MDEFYADQVAAYEAMRSGRPRGPVTGLPSLDKQIGGALSVGLNAIVGRAGSGKTCLGIQIAADCQFPAVIVSCEMSPLVLLRRMAARATNTFMSHFNTMEPEEARARAEAAAATYPHVAILDATTGWVPPHPAPGFPVNLQDAIETVRESGSQVLCMVDSLQSWANRIEGDEYSRLGRAVSWLHELAHGTASVVLLTCEMNRSSANQKGNLSADFLSAAAGHRAIEFQAELLMAIHTDDDEQSDFTRDARLTIEKNRSGGLRTGVSGLRLAFHGGLQCFSERERG